MFRRSGDWLLVHRATSLNRFVTDVSESSQAESIMIVYNGCWLVIWPVEIPIWRAAVSAWKEDIMISKHRKTYNHWSSATGDSLISLEWKLQSMCTSDRFSNTAPWRARRENYSSGNLYIQLEPTEKSNANRYALLHSHERWKRKKSIQQVLTPLHCIPNDWNLTQLRTHRNDVSELVKHWTIIEVKQWDRNIMFMQHINHLATMFRNKYVIPVISLAGNMR